MTQKNRIMFSLLLTVAVAVAYRLALPAATLASNSVTLAQMDNSNASSLEAMLNGNGAWAPKLLLTVVLLGGLAFIWSRGDKP